jgi:galactokinase
MEEAETLSTDSRPPWPERIADAFRERLHRAPQVVSHAPGRVNLLGAHVDHQEGWVLPGAIDRAIWLAAGRRRDRRVLLHALDFGEVVEIELNALPPPWLERVGDRASWADLPAGVAWALQLSGVELCGMEAVFGGDLPAAPRRVGHQNDEARRQRKSFAVKRPTVLSPAVTVLA